MRELYEAGALPRSYATTTNDDQVTWLQQGRAAFTVLPFARYAQLNRQDQSKYPGKHQGDRISDLGIAEGQGRHGLGHRVLGDEHSGQRARQGSRLERHQEISSKAVTTRRRAQRQRAGARLQPTPTRLRRLAAAGGRRGAALKRARVPLPAFPEAVRAQSIFVEEVQLAVLGRKKPREAVARSPNA